MPPASLTALMPTDPSEPAPERTMAKSSPCSAASDRKEKIDRRALPARLVELGDRQMLIGRQQLPIGRNDIDVARFNGRAAGNLGHRHSGPSGENAGKLALVRRIEMHDNNESGVDVVRQAFEKHLQGVDASGGCSDADRRKPLGDNSSLGHLVH